MNSTARIVLIVILVILVIGMLPGLGIANFGYYPSGGLGLVLLIIIILLLMGKL